MNLSHSLFSTQKVPIGAEHSLSTGPKPCGLWVDAERARFVRRPIVEILNSAGEWEPKPKTGNVSLGQLFVRESDAWVRALSVPRMLDGRGFGNLCKLRDQGIYGREIPLATIAGDEAIAPVKWLRKKLEQKSLTKTLFDEIVPPLLPEITGGQVAEIVTRGNTISARIHFGDVEVAAVVDSHGVALLDPPEREAIPVACRQCSELEHDLTVVISNSPAYAWRQLGLVSEDGTPTRRGILFSFFHAGEGLAIAAGLEDEKLSDRGSRFRSRQHPGRPALCRRRRAARRTARHSLPKSLRSRRSSRLFGNGRAGAVRLRRVGSDSRASFGSVGALPVHERIAPARRHRTRVDGMAESAAAYRRRADLGLGALALTAKSRRPLHRQHQFARCGGISAAPRFPTAPRGV